jgi:phosphoribosylaminoimidazolecarboxamide formyltransferase / IMP cyclohydrolase
MSINTVAKIDGEVTVTNVLVSVSNKVGLETLIPGLVSINPNIRFFSTGGTYAKIKEILGDNADELLIAVSAYTGQPEMQGGLVKTLDFKIYLGLLSESYNPAHKQDIARVDGVEFDMVIVNLYPFKETVAKEGATLENARGNIDIGGPCMLRAAAKNFVRVLSLCDPADYPQILDELGRNDGTLSLETRFIAARKAFTHTAEYDSAIVDFLHMRNTDEFSSVYDIT